VDLAPEPKSPQPVNRFSEVAVIRFDPRKRKEPEPLMPILGAMEWRSRLEEVNAEFSAALLGFNGEAIVYCKGISDIVAQEYAMEYTSMLQNRAKGVEARLPRIPSGLFEPNRNLIRSTLEKMWEKYFPEK